MLNKTNNQLDGEYFYTTNDYVITYSTSAKRVSVYDESLLLLGYQLCDAKLLSVKEVPSSGDVLIISSSGYLIVFRAHTRAFEVIPLEQKQPSVGAIFIYANQPEKITIIYGNELFIMYTVTVEAKQSNAYKLGDSKEIEFEILGALKMFKYTKNACYALVAQDTATKLFRIDKSGQIVELKFVTKDSEEAGYDGSKFIGGASLLEEFYFVDKDGFLYTDEEEQDDEIITPTTWLNNYVFHCNTSNHTSVLRPIFYLDMKPTSNKVAIMQFRDLIIVYDFLKQVAGFFSLITGELMFAMKMIDKGRFISFRYRLFFVHGPVSEVVLGHVADLENYYRIMQDAGWERNYSYESTYMKLTRFVLFNAKVVQQNKASVNYQTYFAQTLQQTPTVVTFEVFRKLSMPIREYISNEIVTSNLDCYNLQSIVGAIPCSDNEVIVYSGGLVFGFKTVLSQLQECVHSFYKYFLVFGQQYEKAQHSHVMQYAAQIIIHLTISLSSQILVYLYPYLLYNCPVNDIFSYELSPLFKSYIIGIQSQQCVHALEDAVALYYNIGMNKIYSLSRQVLFAYYILRHGSVLAGPPGQTLEMDYEQRFVYCYKGYNAAALSQCSSQFTSQVIAKYISQAASYQTDKEKILLDYFNQLLKLLGEQVTEMHHKLLEVLILSFVDDTHSLVEDFIPQIKALQPELPLNRLSLNSVILDKVPIFSLKVFNTSPWEHSFAQTFVYECFSYDLCERASANKPDQEYIYRFYNVIQNQILGYDNIWTNIIQGNYTSCKEYIISCLDKVRTYFPFGKSAAKYQTGLCQNTIAVYGASQINLSIMNATTTYDNDSSTSTMTATTRDLGTQFENETLKQLEDEFEKIVLDKGGARDTRSVYAVDVNHLLAEMRFKFPEFKDVISDLTYMQNNLNLTYFQMELKRKLTVSVLSNVHSGLNVYDAVINAAMQLYIGEPLEIRALLQVLGLKFLLCVNCVNLVTCSNIGEITYCMSNERKEEAQIVGRLIYTAASLDWLLL